MIKRLFDFIFAIVLLVFFGIPMIVVSIAIFVSIGSPVLFRQTRPGYLGRLFKIIKFRTMNNDCDSEGKLLPDNKRLTKTGNILRKFSLDELPQLFNVIKGDLSFVGPRPLLVQYLSLYTPEQARRHEAKPGITGWAQVNGRNAISWEEKFEFDVWYVDHQSFFLDMRILWMTLVKTLKKEGINANGHTTMPKFTGSHVKER
ncbi:MAG: sugar transferase [Deltaproteobacteria bacterium]|nr:sugar transferase [Deltaproteobacteria bacterium]